MPLNPFFLMLGWGLVVLMAWTGWGSLLDRLSGGAPDRKADWGLRAGWGMAVSILAGGLLNLLHLARTPVVTAFVLAGALLQAWYSWGHLQKAPRAPWVRWIWLMAVALLPLLHYWNAVSWPYNINPNDDLVAYMVFPQRMLQTGSFLDPFNLRRMAAFGGHSFLQAQLQIAGSVGTFHLLDMGLCPLVLSGLIVGHFKPVSHGEYAKALLLIVAVLFLPVPRISTMSALSGATLLLAVFRTLQQRELMPTGSLWLATAVTGAAAASLRANFWPAPLGALLLACLGSALAERSRWRPSLVRLARDLGLLALCLAPWSLLLYLSSHSLLYPFMHGTHRPEFELYGQGLSLWQTVAWVGRFFASKPAILLLALPGTVFLWWQRSQWRVALPFCLATLATAILTIGKYNWTSYRELWRYTFPLLLPMFIAAVLALLAGKDKRGVVRVAGLLPVVALLLFSLPEGLERHQQILSRLGNTTVLRYDPPLMSRYSRMQAGLPPGKKILTVLDFPALLDFGRNPVYPVDVIGACSPAPGMPFFRGPEALAAYLRLVGVDYVAVEDFGTAVSLYNRKVWIGHSHGDDLPVFTFQSRYFLDFMNNMESLESSRETVFQEGGIRVLKL